jgi:hypothetical protein
MLLSKKQKFIFIHIPKTAGTSVFNALKLFVLWQYIATRILHKFNISPPFDPIPFPSHATATELIEAMGKETFDLYFSFAIVRNPWDLQVSLYKYILREEKHHHHSLVKSFANFDKYLEWRCSEEVILQKDFIYSKEGELLVDFVGRFENLEADFAKICDRIGISTSLPRLNVSNTKPYQEYYNEKTKELLRETFKEDIDLLGYDF